MQPAPAEPGPLLHHIGPTPDELRALVDAVARRPRGNGLVVDPDNGAVGWEPLSDLLERGECFAVELTPDLLALDQDDPGAADTFDEVATRCELAGIATVELSSGSPGRRHLFARVADPALRELLADLARRGGVDVRGRSPIRPPGVRHRSGVAPVLLNQPSWSAALDALGPRRRSAPMPADLWRLVRHGDTERRYRNPDGSVDGSRLTLAICNKAVLAKVDHARVWSLLADPRNAGGVSVRRRLAGGGTAAEREAREFFRRTWDKAVASSWQPRVLTSRNDSLVELARLEELHKRIVFTGRTANTDLCVTDAFLRIAWRQGGPVFSMSVRSLSLESGRSPNTVQTALKRARAQGRLQLVRCSRRDRSFVYRVCAPPPELLETSRGIDTPSLPPGGGRGTVSIWRDGPGHDAFMPGALGAGGYRVLMALLASESSVDELVARTGMSHRSLPRLLGKLAQYGLAEQLFDGAWRCPLPVEAVGDVLDEAAESCGTAGRREQRRERFQAEREAYRRYLAAMDARALAQGRPVPRGAYPRLPISDGWTSIDVVRGPPHHFAA